MGFISTFISALSVYTSKSGLDDSHKYRFCDSFISAAKCFWEKKLFSWQETSTKMLRDTAGDYEVQLEETIFKTKWEIQNTKWERILGTVCKRSKPSSLYAAVLY